MTDVVSYANGPFTRTDSVQHVKAMEYVLNSLHNNVPMEAFQPDTASAVLSYLLIADVLYEEPAKSKERYKFVNIDGKELGYAGGSTTGRLRHPYLKTLDNSFHGGAHRAAFDVEQSKALGAGFYFLGKYF